MPRVWRSDAPAGDPPVRPGLPGSRGDWWISTAALRRLDRTPGPRLTLVVAPAGSGKSRLIGRWLANHPDVPWVWADLHAGDGGSAHEADQGTDPEADPDGDWSADPDAGRRDPDRGELDRGELLSGLARLRSWLADRDPGQPAVIVLGGVEALDADAVVPLIAQLPDGIRAVLIGTGNPLPPGLAVELAGEVEEFGPADLWWPPDAVDDQVRRLTGVPPTAAQSLDLYRLTDGWPAGVIILASAMRRRPAVLAAARSAPEPEILDFITTEVLQRLPAELQEFVLRTSPLLELDPATCQALVPGANPHALLLDAHRYGLLSQDRPFALRPRYRRPVRAAARRALRTRDRASEPALLRTAAGQARARGDGQDALSWFVEAGSWDEAFAVLATAVAEGLPGWDGVRLRGTLTRLPPVAWAADAHRRLVVAAAAALIGDRFLAVETLRRTPPDLVGDRPWWTSLSRLTEALASAGGASGRRAAARAIEALDRVGQDTRVPAILGAADRASLVASAHVLAARAAVFGGERREVQRHRSAAMAIEGAQLPAHLELAGFGVEALSAAWAGELGLAQRLAARARRLAEQAGLVGHPLGALTVLARAELLRARGRSAEALAELDEGMPVVRAVEQFAGATAGGRPTLAAALVLRAGLLLDLGEVAAAGRELDAGSEGSAQGSERGSDQASCRGSDHGSGGGADRRFDEGSDRGSDQGWDDALPPGLADRHTLVDARLRLAADDVAGAERLLATVAVSGAPAALRVGIALHSRTPEAAQRVLESWPVPATLHDGLCRLLSRAGLALALDRPAEAGDCVRAAVTAAEPDGHVQVFLDAPAALWPIALGVLKSPAPAPPWRTELRRRLEEARARAEPGGAVVTRRERAVLEHLARPLTHAQIAAALFVSENTLKSHCRNVYRKLGVNSRADALAVARARGWLPSEPRGDVVLDLDVTPAAAQVEL